MSSRAALAGRGLFRRALLRAAIGTIAAITADAGMNVLATSISAGALGCRRRGMAEARSATVHVRSNVAKRYVIAKDNYCRCSLFGWCGEDTFAFCARLPLAEKLSGTLKKGETNATQPQTLAAAPTARAVQFSEPMLLGEAELLALSNTYNICC
jgi:hypothetical protein